MALKQNVISLAKRSEYMIISLLRNLSNKNEDAGYHISWKDSMYPYYYYLQCTFALPKQV